MGMNVVTCKGDDDEGDGNDGSHTANPKTTWSDSGSWWNWDWEFWGCCRLRELATLFYKRHARARNFLGKLINLDVNRECEIYLEF